MNEWVSVLTCAWLGENETTLCFVSVLTLFGFGHYATLNLIFYKENNTQKSNKENEKLLYLEDDKNVSE